MSDNDSASLLNDELERPAEESPTNRLSSGKMVGAVASAIRILRYLSEASDPVGVTRIAKDLQVNPSTCFNILRTLAAEDFVHFEPSNKSYVISWGVMDLARGATAMHGDISSVRPHMDRIAQQHGVTVSLWQPISNNRKVLILSAITRNAIRIQMAVGQRLPIFIGATGRVLAAHSGLPLSEMRKRFDEIRWDQPITFEEFAAQVEEARRTGWALDDGNFAAGTCSLAVPVTSDSGSATLAVTATMFTGQYDKSRAQAVIDDLQDFARRLRPFANGA